MKSPFQVDIKPDWEGLFSCIQRKGTPKRVHYMELFLDQEVSKAIKERYELCEGLDRSDPAFALQRHIRVQRFLGYDTVVAGPEGINLPVSWSVADDTAGLTRKTGRGFVDLHKGPITNWEEFEKYPWPDPNRLTTKTMEWYQKNLPDDMCIIGGQVSHYLEHLSGLMGYETLCYAVMDNRDLVQAITDKLTALYNKSVDTILTFDRVQFVWGSDDMGFRTGPLLSPKDLRKFVLPGHREAAQKVHEKGRLYLLHCCGKVELIMEDLIEDVGIDAKHSFEDVIVDIKTSKDRYGKRVALLGGIDMDFLCRRKPEEVRKRVRETLEHCHPGGGYCLGTGNTVANYVPVENYLAMLDEGRRFTA